MARDKQRMPNLFIVGAPKCGTTALSFFLAGHPDIFMSVDAVRNNAQFNLFDAKEPGFFAEDSENLFGRRNITELSCYKELFTSAPHSVKWIGESSINYLSSEVAIPNILKMQPDARFIVSVRNPIDVAQGMHNQRVKERSENIVDFYEAWRAQEDRMHGRRLPRYTQNKPEAYQYGELAKIGKQFDRLLKHVSRDRVHVLTYDDLETDPLSVYKHLCVFLGVTYDNRTNFPRINAGKSVRSKRYLRALVSLNAIRKALRIPNLGLGIYGRYYDLALSEKREEKNEKLLNELKIYFKDDIYLLSNLVGRDLNSWMN